MKTDWFYKGLTVNEKINLKSWLQWSHPRGLLIKNALLGNMPSMLCGWEKPIPNEVKREFKARNYDFWSHIN